MVIVELQCFRWKCVLNALRGKSKRNSEKVQKTRKVLLLVNNWKREKARGVVLENSCCGDFQLHSSQITFVATHQCFLFYSASLLLQVFLCALFTWYFSCSLCCPIAGLSALMLCLHWQLMHNSIYYFVWMFCSISIFEQRFQTYHTAHRFYRLGDNRDFHVVLKSSVNRSPLWGFFHL